MIYAIDDLKVKTTILPFQSYILRERHERRGKNEESEAEDATYDEENATYDEVKEEKAESIHILVMSFETFPEIDIIIELADTEKSKIRRIRQLSADDNCTVFCGIKTNTGGIKALSVVVAHKGKVYDIVDRATNLGNDDYVASSQLKLYNACYGKIAVLIDTDAIQPHLWKKLDIADCVICIVNSSSYLEEIITIAKAVGKKAIILTTNSSHIVNT